MLTFLAVAAIGKWKVDSYEDNAVGNLEKYWFYLYFPRKAHKTN